MYIETIVGHAIEAPVHNSALYLSEVKGIVEGYKDNAELYIVNPTTVGIKDGMLSLFGKCIIINANDNALSVSPSVVNYNYDIYVRVDMLQNTVSLIGVLNPDGVTLPNNYAEQDIFLNFSQGAYDFKLATATLNNAGLQTIQMEDVFLSGVADFDSIFPITSVVPFATNVDPNALYKGTEWSLLPSGYVITTSSTTYGNVGTALSTNYQTSSSATALTIAQMPQHNHIAQQHSHGSISHNHSFASHNHQQPANTLTVSSGADWSRGTWNNSGGGSNAVRPTANIGGGANTGGVTNTKTNNNSSANSSNSTDEVGNAGAGNAHSHTFTVPTYQLAFWVRNA